MGKFRRTLKGYDFVLNNDVMTLLGRTDKIVMMDLLFMAMPNIKGRRMGEVKKALYDTDLFTYERF